MRQRQFPGSVDIQYANKTLSVSDSEGDTSLCTRLYLPVWWLQNGAASVGGAAAGRAPQLEHVQPPHEHDLHKEPCLIHV